VNKQTFGVIYKITNLVNGKIYIGQTIRKNPKSRFYEHLSYSKVNKFNMILPKAIAKYGKNNFTFEVLDKAFNQVELNLLEGVYISWFNTLVPNGYNLHDIINTVKVVSKETKLKTSKSLLNQKRKNSSSKYFGVFKSDKYWLSYVIFNNVSNYIGKFLTEIEAAKARDIYILNNKQEHHQLNFPELKDNYLNIKINPIVNQKSSHVYYRKDRNKWRFSKQGYKEVYFNTQEEAENYAKTKLD